MHTEYACLMAPTGLGANKGTAELGMKSIAITDHGVMYGVIDFYKEAVKMA